MIEINALCPAILREDALYKKKMIKEVALIQAYESELRDSSEFVEYLCFNSDDTSAFTYFIIQVATRDAEN